MMWLSTSVWLCGVLLPIISGKLHSPGDDVKHFCAGYNLDYNYDDEYYQYEQSQEDDQYTSEEINIGKVPIFVSESQDVLVNEGDTFSLTCLVDQLGERV